MPIHTLDQLAPSSPFECNERKNPIYALSNWCRGCVYSYKSGVQSLDASMTACFEVPSSIRPLCLGTLALILDSALLDAWPPQWVRAGRKLFSWQRWWYWTSSSCAQHQWPEMLVAEHLIRLRLQPPLLRLFANQTYISDGLEG